MNYIVLNGVKSTEIQGLLICELPPITKPQMRVKQTEIDGRDGSVFEELGYASYEKTIKIGLRGEFDINEVIKYFNFDGNVIFSNEPDKVYKGKIVAQIDFNRLLRYRTATIKFIVQPFKYALDEGVAETETATASGTNIVLKDSGNTPIRIETEAEGVVLHGKNLVNAYGLINWTNTSTVVEDDGYTITTKGSVAYAKSVQKLPLSLRGKTYCLRCDSMHSEQSVQVNAQVNITAPSGNLYAGINKTTKQREVAIPSDATQIEIVVVTNNTSTPIDEDNTLTIKGLRLTPIDFANDEWCPFDGLQTLEVVDGVANAYGYYPVTAISNESNVDMSVEYFKGLEVLGKGLEASKPKMTINGTGKVEISVNDVGIFAYTFPEGENQVVIDSEIEDAYLGDVLKNRNMSGEFPILQVGLNRIGWSGDVESIKIEPRSRWL